MKIRIVFIVLIFLSTLNFPQQNWELLNSGVSSYLQDVYFISKDVGWAVGYQGTILKTTSGGSTWIQQNSNTGVDLLSVFFINENTGWIGGANGIFLKTTDGGTNWENILTNNYNIYSIRFLNDSVGYAISSYITNYERYGFILRTSDGGYSWSIVYSNYDYGFIDLYFHQERGWIVGTNGFLISTIDSGKTWIPRNTNTTHWLYDVFFIDKQFGWAVGGNTNTEAILKTTDGGQTWNQQLMSSQYKWLTGVSFINLNIGWACGYNGVILKTTNGGNSWSRQNISTSNYLRKVVFPDSTTGYIVGQNGTILKYGIKNINIIKPNGGESIFAGSIYNIEWASHNVLKVKIEFSSNGGNSWTIIEDSVESTGIYNWTVPNYLTNQALIKITNVSNPQDYDISNGTFSIISSKFIIVTYPNGGEILQGNSNKDLTWLSNDVLNVKLEFSSNNGASWELIDENIPSSGIYNWLVPNINTIQGRIRISDQDSPQIFDISDSTFRINRTTSVEDESKLLNFNLEQNFPNPFNPSTKIYFTLPKETFVIIKIYDLTGQQITELCNDFFQAGKNELVFNANDLPSGTYICSIIASEFRKSIKMTLMK